MSVTYLVRKAIGLISIIILVACNKDHKGGNSNKQSEFTILEYKVNTPILGVKVDGYKCNSSDYLGNCLNAGAFAGTNYTNSEGKALFDKSLDIKSIKLTKDKYWDTQNNNPVFQPECYLIPVATLKVRIIKVNQFAPGYTLNLIAQPSCGDCKWETLQLRQPQDTVIYFKAAGYHSNVVEWFVNTQTTPHHYTPSIIINRFDTTEVIIQY
jgi:hypothetical protein